ncbi:hypothetical protein EVAR_82031_1 [Eumeta japonica]|uniref:Uncharacterized protein n=1 Tax=Eumeta variegata TaxID=151549 RepID=A0A4C1XIA2_EUMVA|nr:hypothetical protein EVAR_82031_1 [Eumeta japonica]
MQVVVAVCVNVRASACEKMTRELLRRRTGCNLRGMTTSPNVTHFAAEFHGARWRMIVCISQPVCIRARFASLQATSYMLSLA